MFSLLENLGNLLEGRNLGDDSFAEQQADLIDHHQLAGIGDRNRQPSVRGFFQRDEVVAEHQMHRDLFEEIVMQLKVAKIDEFAAVPSGDIACPFQFIARRRRLGRKPSAVDAAIHYRCFLFGHARTSLLPKSCLQPPTSLRMRSAGP